jgi:hypothetical protein
VRARRRTIVVAAIALTATLGLAAALVMRPGDSGRAVEAYLLFLGTLGVALLAQATSRSFPAPTASRLAEVLARPPRKEPRVPELERLEREVEMAMESAYDTYYRLRPTLREIAATRLARSGVSLDSPGGRAEELLGPDAWSIVRPDVERPSDHHATGAQLPTIERAIDALERLNA